MLNNQATKKQDKTTAPRSLTWKMTRPSLHLSHFAFAFAFCLVEVSLYPLLYPSFRALDAQATRWEVPSSLSSRLVSACQASPPPCSKPFLTPIFSSYPIKLPFPCLQRPHNPANALAHTKKSFFLTHTHTAFNGSCGRTHLRI